MYRKIYAVMALGAAMTLAWACGDDDGVEVTNTPAINVTTEKLSPNADESGSVRAYVGTRVTAVGFNLDKVSRVTLGESDAQIVEQDIKTLVFEVPDMGLAQQDDPYRVDLKVYDSDGETVVFRYDYFVTVPVTDALVSGFEPKSGTVGTEVTVSGRNLSQVTRVTVGGVEAALSEVSDAAITLAVPVISASEASTTQDIIAVWSGGTINVSSDEQFTLLIPVFDSWSQSGEARLGDELTLPGVNLDLVQGIFWGEDELLVTEQSSSAITVKIPSGLDNNGVQTKSLTAAYGSPAQKVTVASAFVVDTTPVGPSAPVLTSVSPSDTGYDKLYLGREVTVKGENFASIEGFELDGTAVSLSAVATDVEARFVVPESIRGTAARDVALTAIWNGGNKADFGTVTVYPFHFTKGLRIGIGSNSKNTYPEYNSSNAFILLDEGRVVSVAEWKSLPADRFALSGSNTVTTAANKVTGSQEDYYGVAPYLFAISNSSNKLSLCSPSNTANQLKCHYDSGTALPTTFGTPVMFMRVVTDADLKAAVSGGSLADITSGGLAASSGSPAFGKSETSSVWVKGSVVCIQYVDYSYASQGLKPGSGLAGVRKMGFAVVRDITCGDESTGLAVASREGYIELDLYWSGIIEE